jgi:hypothetical protein
MHHSTYAARTDVQVAAGAAASAYGHTHVAATAHLPQSAAALTLTTTSPLPALGMGRSSTTTCRACQSAAGVGAGAALPHLEGLLDDDGAHGECEMLLRVMVERSRAARPTSERADGAPAAGPAEWSEMCRVRCGARRQSGRSMMRQPRHGACVRTPVRRPGAKARPVRAPCGESTRPHPQRQPPRH